jgi:hypothetical protein
MYDRLLLDFDLIVILKVTLSNAIRRAFSLCHLKCHVTFKITIEFEMIIIRF